MKVKDLMDKEGVKKALDEAFEREEGRGCYVNFRTAYDYFYEKEVSCDVIDELEYAAEIRYITGFGYIGKILSELARAARVELCKKYEITEESRVVKGHVLYRIRLLRDIKRDDIHLPKGTLCGFIEKEDNLSQDDDNSIVTGDACVFGNARIEGNARVGGAALVYGAALVKDHAVVSSSAEVFDYARVSGNALITGNAHVYGAASVADRVLVTGDARIYGDAVIDGSTAIDDGRIYKNDNTQNFKLQRF